MAILAIELFAGEFRVCALAKGEGAAICPAQDFLEELAERRSPDYGRITRYLKWSSEKQLANEEQFKAIGDGFFEFRGRDGARLFAFYDEGALLLCTNGYVKKKNKLNAAEVERAKVWREDYLRAKADGTLRFA